MGRWHDLGHLLTFFLTGTIVLSGGRGPRSQASRALLTFGFCLATESLQRVGTHNLFEWHDLRADALGIGCALVAVEVLQRNLERP